MFLKWTLWNKVGKVAAWQTRPQIGFFSVYFRDFDFANRLRDLAEWQTVQPEKMGSFLPVPSRPSLGTFAVGEGEPVARHGGLHSLLERCGINAQSQREDGT